MRIVAALALVCFSSIAAAAPRYVRPPAPPRPALATAEVAWQAAADERDPARAVTAWQAAAAAFGAAADDERQPAEVRREAAYAALLAWKNALAVDPRVKAAPLGLDGAPARDAGPRPLSETDAGLVAAITRFLALDPAAPDAPGARFLRANAYRRHGHTDLALADLTVLVTAHRDLEVGAYAVNLLLDELVMAGREDELVTWTDTLAADAAFVKAHPGLGERLRDLQVVALSRKAEAAERAVREGGDASRCAALYDQVAALGGERADDARYNAAVCHEWSGDADDALARYLALADSRPVSRHAWRALGRAAALTRQLGRFAEAAPLLERHARMAPADGSSADALVEAVVLRIALGDLATAADDARAFVKTHGVRRRPAAAELLGFLAAAQLAAGERTAAAATTRDVLRLAPVDPGVTPLVWDAACPVEPTAGLCLRRGRVVRDRVLASAARARIAAGTTAPRELLIEADAALEALLAVPRPRRDAGWQAALAALRDRYDRVLAASADDVDVAIVALARAGDLAHRLLLDEEARARHADCARLAAASHPGRLALCEDGLRALGAAPPVDRERVAPPAAGRVAIEPEPPALPHQPAE